jgi:hypothetical protein
VGSIGNKRTHLGFGSGAGRKSGFNLGQHGVQGIGQAANLSTGPGRWYAGGEVSTGNLGGSALHVL